MSLSGLFEIVDECGCGQMLVEPERPASKVLNPPSVQRELDRANAVGNRLEADREQAQLEAEARDVRNYSTF